MLGWVSFMVRVLVIPKKEKKKNGANNGDRLREKVMEVRKQRSEKPWPANDRDVGVILVAHSMG